MLGEELTGLSKELWYPGKTVTMQQRGPEQDEELAVRFAHQGSSMVEKWSSAAEDWV